jgi:hypothetical protein
MWNYEHLPKMLNKFYQNYSGIHIPPKVCYPIFKPFGQVYQPLLKKTIDYYNKSCESKLNLKLNISYEHKAIAWINMIDKHHTKVMKQHFIFYQLYIIYKLFIKP